MVNYSIASPIALGLLGGGALIVTVMNTNRGPVVLITYALLVIVTAIYVRAQRIRNFSHRFAFTLGAFMFATVILYLFVGIVSAKTINIIPVLGHAWRIGLMLLIGGALSAAVATLTATRIQE